MFNYIRFNCLGCSKPLEYAASSDLVGNLPIEEVTPLAALIVDGGTISCSCGKINQLRYNKKLKRLEVVDDI